MKAIATQGLVSKNLNPYMGVQLDHQISFKVNGKNRRFRVFTYQAYSAMGLIGPEMNGIAIADDDSRQIVCDGIAKASSGYFGMSQAQLDEAERIASLPWDQFRDFVNAQSHLRMKLEDNEDEPIAGKTKTGKAKKVKLPVMKDAQFMTAQQKEKVLQDWVRFLQFGFRQKDFTKGLYHHLTQSCSFIAHFDLNGFYFTYFDPHNVEDTLRFLKQFDRASGCVSVEYNDGWWLTRRDYADINSAMADLATPFLPALRAHLNKANLAQAQAELVKAQAKLAWLADAYAR